MSPRLKGIVTIAVWVLFIKGFFDVVWSLIAAFGGITPVQEALTVAVIGIAALILSCVGAWLRKKME